MNRVIEYLGMTAAALALAYVVGTTAVGAITASFANVTANIESVNR